MKTAEEIKKIEAVVLYILEHFKSGLDYIKLFKIMYFAQKDFLVTYGKVLCPDTFKARKYGPVPAFSDKVIKTVETQEKLQGPQCLKDFTKAIKIDNQIVFSIGKCDLDYLSNKEIQCLDKWINYCSSKDSKKELSPESHDEAYLAAWNDFQDDPQKGEMTLIEIARAGGASKKMVDYIREKEIMAAQLS
jgi:uncharacterized phage-associated protein